MGGKGPGFEFLTLTLVKNLESVVPQRYHLASSDEKCNEKSDRMSKEKKKKK